MQFLWFMQMFTEQDCVPALQVPQGFQDGPLLLLPPYIQYLLFLLGLQDGLGDPVGREYLFAN